MLVFQNPGLIPEAALTTMGVSAKVIDNPIGQFGTGIKYAIAIILRHGGKVTIYRGKKALEFGIKSQTIRDKDFKIVTMNGKPLGFTDQVGLNWQPWMAYRELYSNCKDEGGTIQQFVHSGEELGKVKETWIVVEWPEIEKIHEDRHTIILSTDPSYTLDKVEVHPGLDSSHLYYKRIRVMDLTPQAKYTYSLSGHQTLTEDRTLMYPYMVPGIIARSIIKSTNKNFLRSVLDTESVDGRYESKLNYELVRDETPSVDFLEVAEELKIKKRLVPGAMSLFNHYQDTLPGFTSPYVVVDFSQTHLLLIDEALALVQKKFPELHRNQVVFKTKQSHRVQVSQNVMILQAEMLERGKMRLAFAMVEGLAMFNKGGIAEQMACHILTGNWVPEELVEQFSRSADNFDAF